MAKSAIPTEPDYPVLPFKNDQLYMSFDAEGYGNISVLELTPENLSAIALLAKGSRFTRNWESEGGYDLRYREGSTLTLSTVYGQELNRMYLLGYERMKAKKAADYAKEAEAKREADDAAKRQVASVVAAANATDGDQPF